ncbi:hypothetical protein [Zwartia panacis]|uniref:hypothetical protein n=1 Tax=Zwartia panacis TaxID=2683345 RepID=UPI0025B4789D|nr:hypothetical protein [Zwartia panacis]MDN4016611.1 hypothetical protein [Zwartia panacis]
MTDRSLVRALPGLPCARLECIAQHPNSPRRGSDTGVVDTMHSALGLAALTVCHGQAPPPLKSSQSAVKGIT